MSTETIVTILAAIAIAGATVWAVEHLAEQRSRRDHQLEALDQTFRQMVANLGDAAATLAGEGAVKPGRFDADAYPRADPKLVGEVAALRTFYGALQDLHSRPPGSGIRESDVKKIADASVQVRTAIASQEERVLQHRPIRKLTSAEVAEFGELISGVMGAIRDSSLADDALQGRV